MHPPSPRDQPPESATIDELCDLLSDEHRRGTLYYLREHDDAADVDELREHLSERTGSDADEIGVVLRHTVLPKLDDSGVIELDPHRERVRYEGGRFTTEFLGWMRDKERTES